MATETKILKEEDLKRGLKIRLIAHPEYGVWYVQDKYDDGIWEIRGQRGDTTLMVGELRFWERVD